MRIRNKGLYVSMALAVISLAACSDGGKNGGDSHNTSSSTLSQAIASNNKVPANVAVKDKSGLNLTTTTATDLHYDLKRCVSGYSLTDSTTIPVELYVHDQSCEVVLTQFTIGSDIYTQSPSCTWGASATAVSTCDFSSLTASVATITVSLDVQLPSPISATALDNDVSFSFGGENVAKTTVSVTPSTSSAQVTLIGSEAPKLQIFSQTLVDIEATGAGKFDFTLDCDDAVTTHVVTGDTCHGDLLTAMTWALVKDTFSGAPTLADAQAQAYTGSVLAGDLQSTSTHGGFNITGVAGPTRLHDADTDMVLFLRNGTSFATYNIKIIRIP